jgi:translation initiation factor 1
LKEVAKKLKSKLACGGTISGKVIELQGNHLAKVKPILVESGFTESQIIEKK